MDREAKRQIKRSPFNGLPPSSAHILLLTGGVDPPYGSNAVSRQLPQVFGKSPTPKGPRSAPASDSDMSPAAARAVAIAEGIYSQIECTDDHRTGD